MKRLALLILILAATIGLARPASAYAACRVHTATVTSHPVLRGARRWYVSVFGRWTSDARHFCSWSFAPSTGRTVWGPDWQYHGHVAPDYRWRGDGWRAYRTQREWQQPVWPIDCFPRVILRIYRTGDASIDPHRSLAGPMCYAS